MRLINVIIAALLFLLFSLTGTYMELRILLMLLVMLLIPQAFLEKLTDIFLFGNLKRASLALQELEQLNNNLNKAVRFHDVNQALQTSFDRLFETVPFAFYILENDSFYLAHHCKINDSDLLHMDIKAAVFDKLPVQNVRSLRISQIGLDEGITQKFTAAGLTHLYPFLGHTHIFAFLLTNKYRLPILKQIDNRIMFERIQKKAGLILENTGLIIDLEKKNFETRKLVEISQKILSSLQVKPILDFILETVQTLIPYDAAAIFLIDPGGQQLLNTSSRGYPEQMLRNLHLKVGQGASGLVVQSRQVDILDDVRAARHYIQIRPETRSQIAVPLIFEEMVIGVIVLESDRLAFYTTQRRESLELFASLASIAIRNAQQVEEIIAKKALENDLLNAGTVQRSLLTSQFPSSDALKITALNVPSKIVSGDLYDIFGIRDKQIVVTIGDVSGKGVPASLMMTLILASLRSQQRNYLTSCDPVFRLNNLLHESTPEGSYTTFFYGIINMESNEIIYTNAGHNPPFIFHTDGRISRLKTGGIVLGFLANQDYVQETVPFGRGDLFLAFTDGLTETMNSREEEFGEERLTRLVEKYRGEGIYALKEKILAELQTFSRQSSPEDDITIILAEHF